MTRPTDTLEEMCELIVDCPHFTPEWTEQGYIVIRNQNIRDGRLDLSNPSFTNRQDFERRIKRAKPRAGDIIFTREAPMGEVCVVPEGLECCVGQRQVLLRPASVVDGRYLFYALRSEFVRHQILWNEGTGSTVSNVRIPVLKALKIPRLGNMEQDIGALLASLDDKIELNRRMNETLEAMAQAIFRDWFVDFGPTRRKIDGATDPVEIMGGLVADLDRARKLAKLFPANIGDNALPEGWVERPIGELSEIVGGSTPSTASPEFWDGGVHRWSTPKDLSKLEGLFLFDTERRVTDAGLAKIGSGLSPKGTVLLSSRAPIGYIAVADEPTAVNQGFIALRPTREMPTALALFWCQENIEIIKAHANGSTFQEISKKNFRPLPVIFGGDAITKSFDEIVTLLLALVRNRSNENRALAATRDLLLPKLMSGDMRAHAPNAVV